MLFALTSHRNRGGVLHLGQPVRASVQTELGFRSWPFAVDDKGEPKHEALMNLL